MPNVLEESPTAPLEELAGPAVSLTPVERAQRIASIDVLRGFALLGILVLNIDAFGNTEAIHDIPVGSAIDSFSGPHAHWNVALLLIKWAFFEGKMRGIFSMLFGAGVILLTSRAEKRGAGAMSADIYTRRNMLLTLFGLIHGCFIWFGDILFDYGLYALLFLYPARKLAATTLVVGGLLLSLVGTYGIFVLTGATNDFSLEKEAAAIALRQENHQPLSKEDSAREKQWQERVEANHVTPEKVRKSVAEARAPYAEQVEHNAGSYFGPGVLHHIYLASDALSAMLIGMGLFKAGFLTGDSSDAVYVLTALLGFAISIPLYLYGVTHTYLNGFYFITLERWIMLPYELTRDAGMLAIAASVLLLIKRGIFRAPQRWLAAVGKTAFSNYIGTSLVCQFLFVWGPTKLFGKLEYYQLMYVVCGVWAMNLIVSTQWVRHFEYGPLEWVWRSLTYGKAQPMRLKPV